MEEEKERKMYVVTQRVVRKGTVYADSVEQVRKWADENLIGYDTCDATSLSIEEFNPLKSNEEVEKDERG
jgi:hypothetical protein